MASSSYPRQSRQDHHSSCHQSLSFQCQNDRNIVWNVDNLSHLSPSESLYSCFHNLKFSYLTKAPNPAVTTSFNWCCHLEDAIFMVLGVSPIEMKSQIWYTYLGFNYRQYLKLSLAEVIQMWGTAGLHEPRCGFLIT